jgi:4-amino-4-deoxy-L-arabinose transferase-like glycosyltransferase
MSYFNATSYDEGIYLSMSSLVSNGFVLYRDIPFHKPPLLIYMNTAIVRLVGNSLLIARLAVVGVAAISSIIIFSILRMLKQSDRVAVLSAVLFAVFSSLPLNEHFWVLTESYMLMFELAAVFFAIKAFRYPDEKKHFIFSGACAACALLTRQTTLIFILIYAGFLLCCVFKKHFPSKSMFYVGLGMAIPPAVVGIYFEFQSAFHKLVDQVLFKAASGLSLLRNGSLNGLQGQLRCGIWQ